MEHHLTKSFVQKMLTQESKGNVSVQYSWYEVKYTPASYSIQTIRNVSNRFSFHVAASAVMARRSKGGKSL